MSSTALREEFSTLLHAHVPGLHLSGSRATGHVPWREDTHPSFSADLEKAIWYDLARKEGGGVKEFKARLGLNGTIKPRRKIVATYDYRDERNTLLYQVVRYENKQFVQRRPDGKNKWIYSLDGVRRVPYRLADILDKQTVHIAEGEKDTDRLWNLGLHATTNPEGAGKWRAEYNHYFAQKRAVLFADNDEAGEEHAQDVARNLLPVAEAVKLVRLPGLPAKGDVSDWLDAGHTKEELAAIVEATPILRAEDLREAANKNTGPRVTLRHPSELIAKPISWCIDSVLPASMLTVLHAKDKIGKTLLAWEAARAMLQRGLFLGTFSVTPGRVVLALLDDPHDLTVQRRDALGLTHCEDLRIVTPLDADLSDPVAFLADFRKACEAFKPSFIVLDALFHFAPPGRDSMNDAARMRGVMAEFNALAEELHAAVLLIAHDKKDGSDVAGSHVIRATAKALLHLTKPRWCNEEEEEDDGRRILTIVSKLTGEARHLLRNQGVGAWSYLGRGDSARQARTTWAQDRVLTYLKEGGEGTSQEIGKAVKIRKEDALTALTALVEDGQVESELQPRADGKKGKGRLVYRLKAQSPDLSPEKKETGNNRSKEGENPNEISALQDKPPGPGSGNTGNTDLLFPSEEEKNSNEIKGSHDAAPDSGTVHPKEKNGNNRSDFLETAKINGQNGIPTVPLAWNQAGTIGQATEDSKIKGSSDSQSYCSQNPLSRGNPGRENDEWTPYGWFSELSDEDKERWIIEKNQEGAEQ